MMKRSRWLSLIIAAILIVTMLVPVSVFAESDEYHDYTVILHANRPNKVFSIYDGENDKVSYKAEYTDPLSGRADDSFSFDRPYTPEESYPAGYDEWSDGYEFAGWSKTASGPIISKLIEDEEGFFYHRVSAKDLTPDGTTHLYAQWKKTSYVVTFDAGKQGYFYGGRYDYKTDTYVRQKYQKDCESYYMDNPAADRLCEPRPIRTYSPA